MCKLFFKIKIFSPSLNLLKRIISYIFNCYELKRFHFYYLNLWSTWKEEAGKGRFPFWSSSKFSPLNISLYTPLVTATKGCIHCFLESITITSSFLPTNIREKGITTLKIYKYWIFSHTVIETCFEILKSPEHEKSWFKL